MTLTRCCARCNVEQPLGMFLVTALGHRKYGPVCRACDPRAPRTPKPPPAPVSDDGCPRPLRYPRDRDRKERIRAWFSVCAICQERTHRLHIDHDHVAGYVRGALCGRCNNLLAAVRDSTDLLERAVEYLRNPPWPQPGENDEEANARMTCAASPQQSEPRNKVVDRLPATPPILPPTAERTTGESDEPPLTRSEIERRRRSHLATAAWWPRLTLIDALGDWQPYRTTWVTRPLTCHLCGATTHQPAADGWQWRVAQARGKSGRYTQSRCSDCGQGERERGSVGT